MRDGVLTRKRFAGREAARHSIFRAPIVRWWATLLSLSLAAPAVLAAQTYEITADGETFRKTADGRPLAELAAGAQVTLVGAEGAWSEVRLDGWIPAAALAVTDREGHDRIVSRPGGESLYDRPTGSVAARLLQGFLLDYVEEREGWTRVSRVGWVRSASVSPVAAATASPPGSDVAASRPSALVSEGRRLMTGERPIGMYDAPGGDTLASVRPGTPITVVERGNRWTRVRVEGWVPSDELVTASLDSAVVETSAAALRASPDQYRGVRVRWSVQFVALERAEPERTDFYEGEPFILARAPDAGDGFVYVAVPPELLSAVEALEPLEMIEILAQVRTGRSALMGVPVLDLLALF